MTIEVKTDKGYNAIERECMWACISVEKAIKDNTLDNLTTYIEDLKRDTHPSQYEAHRILDVALRKIARATESIQLPLLETVDPLLYVDDIKYDDIVDDESEISAAAEIADFDIPSNLRHQPDFYNPLYQSDNPVIKSITAGLTGEDIDEIVDTLATPPTYTSIIKFVVDGNTQTAETQQTHTLEYAQSTMLDILLKNCDLVYYEYNSVVIFSKDFL